MGKTIMEKNNGMRERLFIYASNIADMKDYNYLKEKTHYINKHFTFFCIHFRSLFDIKSILAE